MAAQEHARIALVAATEAREAAEPAWRQAVTAALAAGIGVAEIARLARITRARVYQIRDLTREDAMRYIEVPDSIDRSRYSELWAESVGGMVPNISSSGRFGYEIATDAQSAAEYSAALDAAGIKHFVTSHR